MKDKIITKLEAIERDEQVKIFYAAESGSRAWGFASKDSDYDVRFLYLRPRDWYLTIKPGKDTVEIADGRLDISGWDLKKALALFANSNPPLYEWLVSPVVYLEEGTAPDRLRKLAPQDYSLRSCVYHYLHIAKNNYRSYLLDEEVKIKKYFYALRPLLACFWIKEKNSLPPMELDKLLEIKNLDPKVLEEIKKLLVRKKNGEELGVEKRNQELNSFIEDGIKRVEDFVLEIKNSRKIKAELLDELFLKALDEYGSD